MSQRIVLSTVMKRTKFYQLNVMTFLFLNFLLFSCGSSTEKQSQPLVNIELKSTGITLEEVETTHGIFEKVAATNKSSIDVSEVLGLLGVLAPQNLSEIADELALNYVDGMDFVCAKGSHCSGKAKGKEMEVTLENVDAAGFKDPTLIFAESIEVDFQVLPGLLEICRISGIKVKSGISANFDGLLLEFDELEVKKATIDIGAFGSYPSKSCR
jgi:hypothetical protein